MRDVIVIASAAFVFMGTVMRMRDSIADVDQVGEFVPRNSNEEFHRIFLLFTLLERRQHASTTDRHLYYLRAAQAWFFLAPSARSEGCCSPYPQLSTESARPPIRRRPS